ncbi:MAG: cation transporter [Candidatus Parabeggiatoa sp. nov. 3]|nr:MAG: cation transporter [Gammaproteobacteria bacterium]RKZ66093.1 MAG: cation transporter [Gammaproteobacteria bacterium]RKZ83087.1 MAG: cation transporter [Gammaproteobacteria bacterium]
MSHHHHHHHAASNIKVVFFLNLSFTLLEIVGGIWTNSVAILSDAVHDLGDSVALGLSWYFANVSQKKRDSHFSYGYKRFSLLGALISSFILLVGSTLILFEAIPRLIHPETVHVNGMILLAILGVLVNGAAVLKLRRGETQNERVVRLHLLEDVFGWFAVLIAGIVMLFVNLPVLDPILSVGITLYILWHVFKNLRETVNVFLQAIPANMNVEQLEAMLIEKLPIQSIHDWHLWTMDGEYHVLSCHVVVADNLPSKDIIDLKTQIRELLKQYNIQHLTIEVEYENECCELVNC